jgi:hypothetical protein
VPVRRPSPRRWLRTRRHLARRRDVILNAGKVDERSAEKAALLEYLPQAFWLPRRDPAFRRHQNLRRCVQMVSTLSELGYLVDVSDRRDSTFRPPRGYDLVISERLDWRGIDRLFRTDPVRVYLATSMNHIAHNRNVRIRHERLRERRGCEIALRRTYSEEMPALADADAIVGVGNQITMGSWREVFGGPVYELDNFALAEMPRPRSTKRFDAARQHFLYFASNSQLQRGLDLLLEIFVKHPRLHLHVCSQFAREEDFCACYREELFRTPNVHPVGWVSIGSRKLSALVETCGHVIHPTCSEGQSGSVVHAMSAGLVPLVTREAGIDTEGFGVTFADDSLDEIERVVVEASELAVARLREQAELTAQAARQRYSQAAFAERWRAVVSTITDEAAAPGTARRTPR